MSRKGGNEGYKTKRRKRTRIMAAAVVNLLGQFKSDQRFHFHKTG